MHKKTTFIVVPRSSLYDKYIGAIFNGVKILDSFKAIINNSKRKRAMFKCECACGKIFNSRADHILNKRSKSCGCLSGPAHILPDNQAAINDIYRNYKCGAKIRNLNFDLSMDEFKDLIFKNCTYCDTKPSEHFWKITNKSYYKLIYNGIDRIDPTGGYTISNCVSCCPQCNYAKSDLDLKDFNKWITQLVWFYTNQKINI